MTDAVIEEESVDQVVTEEVIEEESADLSTEETEDDVFNADDLEFELDDEEEAEEEPELSVKEQLNQSLTTVEKRAYKATTEFVRSGLADSEHGTPELINEIMSNPSLVKVFHVLAQKSKSVQGRVPEKASKPEPVSVDKAYEQVTQFMEENAGKPDLDTLKASFFKELTKDSELLQKEFKDYL